MLADIDEQFSAPCVLHAGVNLFSIDSAFRRLGKTTRLIYPVGQSAVESRPLNGPLPSDENCKCPDVVRMCSERRLRRTGHLSHRLMTTRPEPWTRSGYFTARIYHDSPRLRYRGESAHNESCDYTCCNHHGASHSNSFAGWSMLAMSLLRACLTLPLICPIDLPSIGLPRALPPVGILPPHCR